MSQTIAIIINNITNLAGTERAVVNLANILSKQGNTVYIISTDTKKGETSYPLDPAIKILHLGLNIYLAKKIGKIKQYILLRKQLKKKRNELNIDIFIGTYILLNILITFIKKVKTIGCEHFNYNSASNIHKKIRKLFYNRLNAVVVLTKQDSKHYSFLKNCHVIPNSLSFQPELKKDYNQKIILSIGRYTKQKGFDMLIKSASLLKSDFPEWKFLIIGEGEDKELLESLINKYDLKNYIILQPSQKDVIALYKSASIYCMSSRWEGMPMVLIEAQAMSLPIVSFNCPEGPAQIITNDEDGFLCPEENEEYLSKKLALLMNDSKLRKQMGNNAYKNSFRFSTEAVSKLWEDLICKM